MMTATASEGRHAICQVEDSPDEPTGRQIIERMRCQAKPPNTFLVCRVVLQERCSESAAYLPTADDIRLDTNRALR